MRQGLAQGFPLIWPLNALGLHKSFTYFAVALQHLCANSQLQSPMVAALVPNSQLDTLPVGLSLVGMLVKQTLC